MKTITVALVGYFCLAGFASAKAAPGELSLDVGLGGSERVHTRQLYYQEGPAFIPVAHERFAYANGLIFHADLHYEFMDTWFVGLMHDSAVDAIESDYGYNLIYIKKRWTWLVNNSPKR